jgi:phosphate transport system substrate-binding protein
MTSLLKTWGPRVAAGLAVAATLAVAGCGTTTTSTTTGGATSTPSTLLACTANLPAGNTNKAAGAAASPAVSGKLAIDGSTALAPLFSQLATTFDGANGTQTTVTANGSGTGLKDVESGAVQIGMSDVFAAQKDTNPPKYGNLVDYQVAALPFTLITNNDLKGKVNNLTTAQIKQIYTGQATNWQQFGGPAEPITTVARPTSSGTRAVFDTYILGAGTVEQPTTLLTQDTSGAVETAVAATPGSIGYLAASYVANQGAGQAAPICIDGHDATAANINNGSYNFWSIEHAYTKGPATGAAKAFLQFAVSSAVQTTDVPGLNFLQLSSVSSTAIQAHTPANSPTPGSLS